MTLLGKSRPVLYAALPVVLVIASRRIPAPWYQGGCLDALPVITGAVSSSALLGAIVLAACLARLGTGRAIPLVPILLAGCAPWFAVIGTGLGLWKPILDAYNPDYRGGLEFFLSFSAELQSARLTALLHTASLLLATVLVLLVETLVQRRRPSPEPNRPGRWHPKTATVIAASALCLCLLAILDAWWTIQPVGEFARRLPHPDFLEFDQWVHEWLLAHRLYGVGTGLIILGALVLGVRSSVNARARRPVVLWPTVLAVCAAVTLLLDARLFDQTFWYIPQSAWAVGDSSHMADWMPIPGFTDGPHVEPALLATPEGLRHAGGLLPWEVEDTHMALVLLEEAQRTARMTPYEAKPDTVTVAMHARLETKHLRRLFEVAAHSSLGKLVLVGKPTYPLSEPTRKALSSIHPSLESVASTPPPAVSLLLECGSSSSCAEPPEDWWTADIGPAHRVTLTRFPSGAVEVLDLRYDAQRLDEAGPRFLRVSEGADVADVLEILRRGKGLAGPLHLSI
ncbi:hypothetical protein JRI60_08840 [Archangium violaceum]|uniref:hypothetical protein n=1 Tax=Archangium violaceum TaxID=83451 RepID=UPI001951CA7D|nr:hypothetical protein [Archangium violaceum]QRN99108.1 hypothetical protein JRI60_08840 [Archangium violaceum]